MITFFFILDLEKFIEGKLKFFYANWLKIQHIMENKIIIVIRRRVISQFVVKCQGMSLVKKRNF